MTRPRKIRHVSKPPVCDRFKPVGIPARFLEQVDISIDEYEALRLADYQGLSHEDAAKKMNISRPTFSRLITTARNKIAAGIIEGKEISIEGGDFQFTQHLMQCNKCRTITPYENVIPLNCPECNSADIENLNQRYHRGRGRGRRGFGRGR